MYVTCIHKPCLIGTASSPSSLGQVSEFCERPRNFSSKCRSPPSPDPTRTPEPQAGVVELDSEVTTADKLVPQVCLRH